MSPASITEKLCGFWHSYLSSDKAVLVAVSGGSDSVALIYLLQEMREKLKINKLAIAHINHGLRGDESDGDEQYVRKIATDLKIPFFLKRLSGHKLEDPGIEKWARQERYHFLHSIMESCCFDFIATGHTADDQAETLLFRMLRGAGIKGMRGILPLREDRVIRPILFVSKNELINWLEQKGIAYRSDSSNNDISISRNFIRHKLISIISEYQPDAAQRLTSLSLQMQNAWNIIENQTQKWIGQFVLEDSDNSFVICNNGFASREIASEALKYLFEKHGIEANRFHIEKVLANIKRSRTFLLPAKWQYNPSRETVCFHKESGAGDSFFCRIPIPGMVQCSTRNINFTVKEITGPAGNVSDDNWSAFMDRDSISGNSLIYRQVNDDDVFCPLGRSGSTNVLRFLAKQGFSKVIRSRAGVVVDDSNKILWIPGVRLNQLCAVSKYSRSVIKITSKNIGNNI
ncbi:MAG TPA: tRNA lysidine(34) synthetase TilS [Chitinispirillaceae bacterium]|nr:tRNA lysidine(34) synthetase TilS [Chitinispirillaceae bacterium]